MLYSGYLAAFSAVLASVDAVITQRQAYPPMAEVMIQQNLRHRHSKFFFSVLGINWEVNEFRHELGHCFWARELEIMRDSNGAFRLNGWGKFHGSPQELAQCFDTAIVDCGGPPHASGAMSGGDGTGVVGDMPSGDGEGEGEAFHKLRLSTASRCRTSLLSARDAVTPAATIVIGPVDKEKRHKYSFELKAFGWDAGKLREPLSECIDTQACDIVGFGEGDSRGWVLVRGLVKAEAQSPLEHVMRCLDRAVLASGGPAHVTDTWTDRPTCTKTGDGMPGLEN